VGGGLVVSNKKKVLYVKKQCGDHGKRGGRWLKNRS